MDIHAAVNVVNIGTGTVSSRTDHAAIRGVHFMTARWRRMTGEGPRRSRASCSASSTTGSAGMHSTGSARMPSATRPTRCGMARAARVSRCGVPHRAARVSGCGVPHPTTRICRRRMPRARATRARSARRRSVRRVSCRPVRSARRWAVHSARAPTTRRRTVRSLESPTRSATGMGRGRRGMWRRRGRRLLLIVAEAYGGINDSQGEQQPRCSQGGL
jgi:hypothetical protein